MTLNRKLAGMSNKLQIDNAGLLHCQLLMSFREGDEITGYDERYEWVDAIVRSEDICYATKRASGKQGILLHLMSESVIVVDADYDHFYAIWHNYLNSSTNYRFN